MRRIAENDVVKNKNYKKFINAVNTYNLINSFNFIEHWNQLWSYFMGFYGDFWFEPLALSSIDFDTQKNSLFSYPDFDLSLVKGKINTNHPKYFQNSVTILVIYMGISLGLFFLSYLLFMKKNIG